MARATIGRFPGLSPSDVLILSAYATEMGRSSVLANTDARQQPVHDIEPSPNPPVLEMVTLSDEPLVPELSPDDLQSVLAAEEEAVEEQPASDMILEPVIDEPPPTPVEHEQDKPIGEEPAQADPLSPIRPAVDDRVSEDPPPAEQNGSRSAIPEPAEPLITVAKLRRLVGKLIPWRTGPKA